MPHHKKPVRVLVVDESALVRRILATGFAKCPGLIVVGEAADPNRARDLLAELRPDVVTLDLEMPGMDGVAFLKQLMSIHPVPTVVISSPSQVEKITLDALEAGAVDVIARPANLSDGPPGILDNICRRVTAAATLDVSQFVRQPASPTVEPTAALRETTDWIIAIGASTGGVPALTRILPAFSADSPGIVIVIHMPAGFTETFAERLNKACPMRVKEAEDGDRILPGQILLAPGGKHHMKVVRSGGQYRVKLVEGEEVNFSRPAVDVLFHSIAQEAGRNVSAALLTGMGKDGAAGLLAIRKSGGRTVAQDQATSVMFGMPGAAVALGAAESVSPLEKIPSLLIGAFRKR